MTTSALAPAPFDSPWQTMPILGPQEMPLQPDVKPPGWASTPTPEQLQWSSEWMALNRPGG